MRLTASTTIRGDFETIWERTQNPEEHVRWDVRFSEIGNRPRHGETDSRKFSYVRNLGLGFRIEGWGETLGAKERQGSSLKFGSEDRCSLIEAGSGCWVYEPVADGIRFWTVYDYRVRFGIWGRVVDGLIFRPLMIWGTRWSFDQLRLWVERKIEPELCGLLWIVKVMARVSLGLVWILEGWLPKLWMVDPAEVDLVRRSGLWLGSPAQTLATLGVVEIGFGLILLSGWKERWGVVLATVGMLILTALVLWLDPGALADPYGGLIKHVSLVACAVVVWCLTPWTPDASRAAGPVGEGRIEHGKIAI